MTTDYDQISQQYKKAKQHEWRSRIEGYSMMKLIGPLAGRKVIDIACGEGHFTRKLRQAGAGATTGIDLSCRMIELARAQEASVPLGIDYRMEDACADGPTEDFDLAAAAWLLVYARTRPELSVMCRGIARRLKPGGRFVTVMNNPDLVNFRRRDYRKYGCSLTVGDPIVDGTPILWTIHLDDSSFDIENYYLPLDAYESALGEAGFRDVRTHAMELGPHPDGTDDREVWMDWLAEPPAILLDCVKC
ncbi:hypothetical protein YTPLAS18_31660 [Nitrospira sp.]|nr:hypothetical protein YTPLAS18_31660 [Nitrospira sp.]